MPADRKDTIRFGKCKFVCSTALRRCLDVQVPPEGGTTSRCCLAERPPVRPTWEGAGARAGSLPRRLTPRRSPRRRNPYGTKLRPNAESLRHYDEKNENGHDQGMLGGEEVRASAGKGNLNRLPGSSAGRPAVECGHSECPGPARPTIRRGYLRPPQAEQTKCEFPIRRDKKACFE